MALISCPECEREVSDRAPACPSCGFPFTTTPKPKSASTPPSLQRPSEPPTSDVIFAMLDEIDFKKGVGVVLLIVAGVGLAVLTVSLPALGILLAFGCVGLSVISRLGKSVKLGEVLRPRRDSVDTVAVVIFVAVTVGLLIHYDRAEEVRQEQERQLRVVEAERSREAQLAAFLAEAPALIAAAENTVRETGLLELMEREDYDAVIAICDSQIPMDSLKRISDYRPNNARVAQFIKEAGSVCNTARREVAQKKAIAEAQEREQRSEQLTKQIIANTKAAIVARYPDALTAETAYENAALDLARIPKPALSKRRAEIKRLNAQLERKKQAVMYKALLLRHEQQGIGHVKASTLRRAFDKNEVDAERRYTGRKFLVEGVISSINTSIFNSAIVLLRTGAYFSDFHGELLSRGEASGLRKGQRVIMLCKIDTAIVGSPTGSDCDVVRWWGGRD